MSKDILSLISSKMNTFSKGQKLIANYILSSYDKAAFMTASKLGKTVHVSESTVVRFASELKYDGYPAMQKALQEMIRNRLTSIQRIEVSNDHHRQPGRGHVRHAVGHGKNSHDHGGDRPGELPGGGGHHHQRQEDLHPGRPAPPAPWRASCPSTSA